MKLKNGFTLIELIAVIAILAIISVFVTSMWTGTSPNMAAQASQLENDLRYTQTLSMTKNQRFCLVFGAANYQIVNSATASAMPLAFGSTTVNLGNTISFGTFSPSGLKMLVFDGKGTPYSSTASVCNSTNAAAAAVLTASATIPLNGGGATKNVIVYPETGAINTQ